MPQVAISAAFAGAAAFMQGATILSAVGYAAFAGGVTLLSSKLAGNPATSPGGSTVPPLDHSLGFAPYPQYPNSETPVPIVFGQARVNGLVVHQRVYGGNYEKAHYLAVLSEVGTTLDQLYIDKFKIEDLPNFYTRTGNVQDENSSWYNFYPNGGEVAITLNNSGTNAVAQTLNQIGELAAPLPALFYGGGTITLFSAHSWPKSGSTQQWQWVLQNIDQPSQIIQSALFTESFIQSQEVDTGCFSDETVFVPGSALRSTTINIPDPLSRWAIKLVCSQLTGGTEGGGISFYKFDIVDDSYTEVERINAGFVHVHLVRDKAITSDNPIINALLYANVVSGNQGNPANALHSFLTDPVKGISNNGVKVDFDSVLDVTYWCENNNLGFNRAYSSYYTREQALKEITAAGRIMLTIEDGVIRLEPERAEETFYLIDDGELLPGSLKLGRMSGKRPNRIEAQYVEPFYGHSISRVMVEDIEAISKYGLQSETVDLTGVTSQKQAYDLAQIMLRQVQLCPYWCECEVGLATAKLLPVGRVVEFANTRNPLVNSHLWRLVLKEEIEPHIFRLRFSQYKDEVYEPQPFAPWYHQVPGFEAVNGWPGPSAGPASVLNLQIERLEFPAGAGLVTNVTISFIRPTERFDFAKVQYTHDGITWLDAGTTQGSPFTFSWPMRWGLLTLRVVTINGNQNNESLAPTVAQYVTGRTDETDYPGWLRGQWVQAPWCLG